MIKADPPRRPPTAHPRSRGEHCRALRLSGESPGSSPLARGTWVQPDAGYGILRLIPARAGNMWCSRPFCPLCQAHPRSRGEHHRRIRVCLLQPGSSPLARGTLPADLFDDPQRRLIPARAGNIKGSDVQHGRSPAHPRSRGEHRNGYRNFWQTVGSSPLARGTFR